MKKLTKEQFIEKAKLIHKGDYDYSLVEYVNYSTKVKLKCNNCGKIFEQTPRKHLSGQGCKKCETLKSAKEKTLTAEQFIEKAKLIHYDKYDYSKVEYDNSHTKVLLKCNKHNYWFKQTPTNHLQGKGCPICKKEKLRQLKTATNFVEKSKLIYGNKYDYSFVNYINRGTKVKLKCNDCGAIFEQTPNIHFKHCGCYCKPKSKGEEIIKKYLEENDIDYIYQKKFNDLKDDKLLSYDFYLPEQNLLIEYNGEQHYSQNSFNKSRKKFLKQKHHDWLKRKYSKVNKINLLTISYKEDIIKVLKEKI